MNYEIDLGVGLYHGEFESSSYPDTNPFSNEIEFFGQSEAPLKELSFMGEVNCIIPIDEMISVSGGIGYTLFNGQFNATNHSIYHSSEGISSSTSYLALYPKNIHYLTLPLKGIFHLGKFQFELGLQNRVLLGATGKRLLVTQVFRQYQPQVNENPIEDESTGWIATHGIKKYHLQFQFGIKYVFFDKLGLKFVFSNPITNLVKDPANIPSGNTLLNDGANRPGGISLHLAFLINRNNKTHE